MNVDKIQRLENNPKFKRKFYSRYVWRNYAIVPPSGVLFTALFGFLYLFNTDRLMSLYVIPFVILLLLGTFWLKATRRYIIRQKMENSNLLICLSIPFIKEGSKTICMFSTGRNRLNKHYLEKEKKEILEKMEQDEDFKKLTLSQKTGNRIIGTDLCLINPLLTDRFSAKNAGSSLNRYLVSDGLERVRFLTSREMERFS